MHLNIVKHFLKNNLDVILEKSLKNVHCYGMDSIVFDNTKGSITRMFIANENHEMWKNGDFTKTENLSIAIHPHHCDLTIVPIKGSFENIRFVTKKSILSPIKFNKFLYKSKIKDGQCHFKNLGEKNLYIKGRCWYNPIFLYNLELKAPDLHTVNVRKGELAAWAIYEGKEDKNYKSICYSNSDLNKFDSSRLYKKMDKNYLYKVLKKVYPEL